MGSGCRNKNGRVLFSRFRGRGVRATEKWVHINYDYRRGAYRAGTTTSFYAKNYSLDLLARRP